MPDVQIGPKTLGQGRQTFIIAELGINHNGDLDIAKELIDVAVKAGADAVKFQKRTVPVVFSNEELQKPRDVPRWLLEKAIERKVLTPEAILRLRATDFADTQNSDQKYALEFSELEYAELDVYCRRREILWTASPWDEDSVDFLAKFDVPFYKVASASLTDDGLLRHIRSKARPVVLSTGGSTLAQVDHAVDMLGMQDLVLLQCTAAYPKNPADALSRINLKMMDVFRRRYGVPVGFSSNDGGRIPAFAAAARGAVLIEMHLTLGHKMWGSDQPSSMEPVWFRDLCEWTRNLPSILGDGKKVVYPEEVEVMKKLRRK